MAPGFDRQARAQSLIRRLGPFAVPMAWAALYATSGIAVAPARITDEASRWHGLAVVSVLVLVGLTTWFARPADRDAAGPPVTTTPKPERNTLRVTTPAGGDIGGPLPPDRSPVPSRTTGF